MPATWTLADSAAVGTYLIGQFTVFGGQQGQQAEALRLAMGRLGRSRGTAVYNDLRLAADPSAVTTLTKRYRSDSTGRLNPRSTAMNGLHLPRMESNAVLVDAKRSGTGQALAVMGPQVGYYTPEVFLEYELPGPGIDESGVSFPGSSPYALIGHGIDFAWTGTSAYSANEDVFAARLCNPDGSKPGLASSHYVYHGRCTAFAAHDVVETTPVAPSRPSVPSTVTLHALNSVHGPIASLATVHGAPVALAVAAARAATRPRATSRSCAWPRTSHLTAELRVGDAHLHRQ